MLKPDDLIVMFDRGLRTVFGTPQSLRPVPGEALEETRLDDSQRRLSAALMRVDHTGEICAQALYQAQALTARRPPVRDALEQAAREETEHLAWTESRINELGGRKSVLNPLWYAGSFAIGAAAGLLGDRWNFGFLAETERQVVHHLDGHLTQLPAGDEKSRAILTAMKADEARHATGALKHGGVKLPLPARFVMRAASRVMTGTAFWI
ncbi:MAG TPA: 2-polyprenyl-3-methyl-6-methoxy-1,4-benzoquinone monooxygenase [Burkholderiales bacterium]|nr:2-polyprenyl-3-methyl-6-methoxy-1,4-benzoquinone monooxygenase [Burkholderiales bacterium]